MAKRKTGAYWVFVLHDTHVSFRSDSGYTGSNPYTLINGGKTQSAKAHALARSFGLSRREYEILDDRSKKNPRRRKAAKKRRVGYAPNLSYATYKKRVDAQFEAFKKKGTPARVAAIRLGLRRKHPRKIRRTKVPQSAFKFAVQRAIGLGKWQTLAKFTNVSNATQYARAYHKQTGATLQVIRQ